MRAEQQHEEIQITSVQITSKMIEAGVNSYLSWDHQEDFPEEIVAEIYLAMVEQRP